MTQDTTENAQKDSGSEKGFLARRWPDIFLVCFALYLVLLSIGVVAELFDIQWILDWWIWRPPGKPPG